MSKEQQEVLDDAYNRYRATIIKEFYEDTKELRKWATVEGPGGHTKEEFINKCNTDTEFSEKWGLKIEERELSLEERQNLYFKLNPEFRLVHEDMDKHMDKHNTPIKLITITYNDKTITSCE
jgi:uncharacterized protein with von Willebrand factor type A (vWA) domain